MFSYSERIQSSNIVHVLQLTMWHLKTSTFRSNFSMWTSSQTLKIGFKSKGGKNQTLKKYQVMFEFCIFTFTWEMSEKMITGVTLYVNVFFSSLNVYHRLDFNSYYVVLVLVCFKSACQGAIIEIFILGVGVRYFNWQTWNDNGWTCMSIFCLTVISPIGSL